MEIPSSATRVIITVYRKGSRLIQKRTIEPTETVETRTTSRSARFLSSSSVLRKDHLFLESIQTRHMLSFTVSDFVQDLYLKELKLGSTSQHQKVARPMASPEFSIPTLPFAQYDAS